MNKATNNQTMKKFALLITYFIIMLAPTYFIIFTDILHSVLKSDEVPSLFYKVVVAIGWLAICYSFIDFFIHRTRNESTTPIIYAVHIPDNDENGMLISDETRRAKADAIFKKIKDDELKAKFDFS